MTSISVAGRCEYGARRRRPDMATNESFGGGGVLYLIHNSPPRDVNQNLEFLTSGGAYCKENF